MAGFLDDLPDLGLPERIGRRKKRPLDIPVNVVIYKRVRCPNRKCRSLKCPVTNTQPEFEGKIIRHHKCQDCELCFKSVEIID